MKSHSLPSADLKPGAMSSCPIRALAVMLALAAGAVAMRADPLMKYGDSPGAGTTFTWASQYFGPPFSQGSSPGEATLSASRNGLAVDVSFDPAPVGPAEGAVNHLRIQATTPPSFQGTGLFSGTAFSDFILFTGVDESDYTIYSAYYWRITNDFSDPLGATMDFSINGLDPTGIVANGLTPTDMTGSGGGEVHLDQPYHQFRPDIGAFQPEIGFGLGNGAGTTSSGGSATLDVWYAFSNSPITDFNPLQGSEPSSVPEGTSTLGLLGLAVGGLIALRRRVA
jgi:hypothetical protein